MILQHQFFEQTAKKHPNFIAVDDHGKKITYKNLDLLANKIANFLFNNDCKNNDRVCILTNKNINLYASILGILKAGACWIPLSSYYPIQRIKTLIKDLSPKFIIVESEYYKLIKRSIINRKNTKILIIDLNRIQKNKNIFTRKNIFLQKNQTVNTKIYSNDIAYIIFTSGSTGKPKGVMVTHENTSHFIRNSSHYFKVSKKLRFAHISEIVFDPSIFDLFICWKNAGTVIPFNKKNYKVDAIDFFKKNKKINVCFFLPSFFKKLADLGQLTNKNLLKLKHIVLSGEPADSDLVMRIYKNIKNVNIYNAYGTTESAIISHWYKIPKLKNFSRGIPVGKELPNVRTILLKENKECRIGENGLAFFSGPQISIGYWNNTFMNNKYFVKNPINLNLNQTIYKAGDILRKDIDGLFYYIGRLDNQIKLRGNRFELGEIENFIKDDENVDECVAIPFSRTNNNLFTDIFLFIKLLKNKDKKYFFNKIAKTLPKYMEPTEIFIQNIDFPRNLNGKIDKKKLLKTILKYLA